MAAEAGQGEGREIAPGLEKRVTRIDPYGADWAEWRYAPEARGRKQPRMKSGGEGAVHQTSALKVQTASMHRPSRAEER